MTELLELDAAGLEFWGKALLEVLEAENEAARKALPR
jgi:hypothetical protein